MGLRDRPRRPRRRARILERGRSRPCRTAAACDMGGFFLAKELAGGDVAAWMYSGLILGSMTVPFTHLRTHGTKEDLVCLIMLEKKETK